jgi:hypothetical protein
MGRSSGGDVRAAVRFFIIALIASAVALTVAGCQDVVGPSEEIVLARAQLRWEREGPASYDYVLRWGCGECVPEVARAVRIVVVNRTVISRRYVATGVIVPAQLESSFPAIEGLFQRLREALSHDPAVFDARYHARLGHPLHASVDYSKTRVDDEMSITVTDLRGR